MQDNRYPVSVGSRLLERLMTRSPFATRYIGPLVLPLTVALMATSVVASTGTGQVAARAPAFENELLRYSARQLDNLLGPIALYPDALLAQVLVAATFPDQVEEAARYMRANGTSGIDDQSWDVSVKAVAHYASALNMMADKSDWTTTLGTAYANQSSEVMASIQRLRSMAAQQGNLESTSQQQVITTGNSYVITPTQSRVIYVPVYDPVVIYTRPVFRTNFMSRFWSFGVGFPIGGWLSYDCDWGLQRVYYNGWNSAYYEYGGGWRARSRPFVQITNVYVNPRYRTVYVNRDVGRRPINYRNVDRYVGVHRDTYFDGRRDGSRDGYRDARGGDLRNGDSRNGDSRNGDSRNGDSLDGRNGGRDENRNGVRGGDDNTGRTAQPRDDRAVLTPDGYRRGGENRAERNGASAPSERRKEPQASEIAIARPNDGRGGTRREGAGRGEAGIDEASREAEREARGDRPRVAMPQIPPVIARPPADYPRARPPEDDFGNSIPRQSAPRDIQRDRTPRVAPQPRPVEPRQVEPRQAQPRASAPRESAPRESAPRGGAAGGGERSPAPRTDSRTARGRIGS